MLRILSWLREHRILPKPKPMPMFTVVLVEEGKDCYVLTLTGDDDGLRYQAYMFYVHPVHRTVAPRPQEGAKAYRIWLDMLGRWKWYVQSGELWWGAL